MLFACARLYCCINLSGNTKICKGGKRRVPVFFIIPHRLEQPDHSLLDQILLIRARKIHQTRLSPHQILIFFHQIIHDAAIAVPQPPDQFIVLTFFVFFMLPANFANFLSAALTADADAQFHKPEHPLPRKRSENRYCLSSEWMRPCRIFPSQDVQRPLLHCR